MFCVHAGEDNLDYFHRFTFYTDVGWCLVCPTVTHIFSFIALLHLLQDQTPAGSLWPHGHSLGGSDLLVAMIPKDGDVFAQLTVQGHLVLLCGRVILQLHHEDGVTLLNRTHANIRWAWGTTMLQTVSSWSHREVDSFRSGLSHPDLWSLFDLQVSFDEGMLNSVCFYVNWITFCSTSE